MAKNNKNNNGYSMNYNGKSYQYIDIDNLKQANDLMAKQLKLQSDFIKKQEKMLANGKKLSTLDTNIYNSYKKQSKELGDNVNRNQKIIDSWNRNIRNTLKTSPNKTGVLGDIIQASNTRTSRVGYEQMPKNIADIFRTSISNGLNQSQLKETNKIYEKAVDSVIAKYKRKGADFSDATTMAKVNEEIKEKTISEMGGITDKYSKATTVLSIATDVFKEAVNTWVRVFKSGLSHQKDVYESTFEPISVRNNTTRGMYYAAQSELGGFGKNRLAEMGLNDNIATSDVQKMWAKMAENGIKIDMSTEESRAEVSAKAIDLVLTNKIVPFLDTSSESVQLLNERLGDSFVKQIRGISQASLEVAGNNVGTSKVLNELIDLVQPMSDEALSNLAKGSTELTALYNRLIAPKEDGGYGYSTSQANDIIKTTYKSQAYNNQMLKSGNLKEQLFALNLLENNINTNDLSQLNNAAGAYINTKNYLASWFPSVNGSAMNQLIANEGKDAVGLSWEDLQAYEKYKESGVSVADLVSSTEFTDEDIKKWASYKTDQYGSGNNQTNQTLQDITVENLANELAVGEQWMGHWTSIIETAIKGIGTILLTKIVGGVIGKGISALSGISAGGITGTSTGGLLGTTGKMVAGIGGIALASAALIKIGDSINSELLSKQQYNANVQSTLFTQEMKDELNGTGLENNSAAVAVRSAGEGYNAGKGNWQTIFDRTEGDIAGDWWADTKGLFGNWADKAWFFNNPSKNNAQEYNSWLLGMYLNENHSMTNNDDYMHLLLTYYALMASQGLDGNYTKNADVNDANVKQYIKDVLADEELFKEYGRALNVLQGEGIVDKYGTPIKDNWTDIQHQIIDWSSHRYGLDYVPYDNYRAELHEGEAVLTASTASELRNLIDEYRNTAKQSVQFDVIIQNQTNALVNKMGEIIAVMQNNRPIFPTTAINKGNEILNYSMTKMVSTRDFSQ